MNKYKINWTIFKRLWESNADLYDYYEELKLNRYINKTRWEYLWGYFIVDNSTYHIAKSELINILIKA